MTQTLLSFNNQPAQSLERVQTPHSARPLAILLVIILITILLLLIFVPWQQSVTGIGQVTSFSPMDRPQTIDAQIKARIVRWFVKEGDLVQAGQPLVELADIDPKFLDRLQPERLQAQKTALESKRDAALSRSAALNKQYHALIASRNASIPSAGERFSQAKERRYAAKQAVDAAEQTFKTALLNRDRVQTLFEKGLRSTRDKELTELDYARAQTELERAKAALQIAERDNTVASLDQNKVIADTAASLESIQAAIASAQEAVATANSDLLKLEVELQNVSHRAKQWIVQAPMTGRLVRAKALGPGQAVDAGYTLAVIVPKTADQAVEIYLSDNDAPLVSPGRHVRLQFAGWPALQFTGWPSVAVGTFAGKVTVVDAVDNGFNQFRILIQPDWELIHSGKEQKWPKPEHLRPGAKVVGWVMLDTVSLGYELWRQFNAFPPTIKREEDEEASKKQDDGKGTMRKVKK